MKLAICSELFKNWQIENIISYCANIGYDGLEISATSFDERPDNITLKRRDIIRNFADNHKIEIIGLHQLLSASPNFSISSPDPKDSRRSETGVFLGISENPADLKGELQWQKKQLISC